MTCSRTLFQPDLKNIRDIMTCSLTVCVTLMSDFSSSLLNVFNANWLEV